MPLRYHLISFDLDGTLVDTAFEIAEAANLALADAGLPRRSAGEVAALVGGGTRNLMAKLLAQATSGAPADRVDELLARFKHHYAGLAGSTARPYDGWPEALAQLRGAGIHLACVTNKDEGFSARILEATGLAGFFELLIGGDTLAHMKPHASVIEHAVRHFGVAKAATAHLGDSRTDVRAARNAGVAAWAVPWGYNAGEPIEAVEPDRIFHSLPELVHHVLGGHGDATTSRA